MIVLAGGDILRRDEILWGFSIDECRPFLKYRAREILFREAVIGFTGADAGRETLQKIETQYCKACKLAKKGKQDCASCDRKFEVSRG